jgi:ABC-type oligopeptide transport system ATPase subunit
MYLGEVVEIGEPAKLFRTPRHPYTEALVASIDVTCEHSVDLRRPCAVCEDVRRDRDVVSVDDDLDA